MPPIWVSSLETLALVFAVTGAGSAALQLAGKLSGTETPRTAWLRRMRDGLTAATVVTALSIGALALYFYVLR